jgi:hypothetical protein
MDAGRSSQKKRDDIRRDDIRREKEERERRERESFAESSDRYFRY